MELARVGRMEHLAFASEATLEQLCATIEGALLLPEMQLDFENDTEWGCCQLELIEYTVSRPYEAETLRQWDDTVPVGCTVGISLAFDRSHPRLADENWILEQWLPSVGERLARALGCPVHHHRTWRGVGANQPCACVFAP